MSESFAQLFEESLSRTNMNTDDIIVGKVIKIDGDYVIINAGLKSEGYVPIEQFFDENGVLEINIGDEVEVSLEAIEDGFGRTRLSREKAKKAHVWQELANAHEAEQTIIGTISGKVKGGFTVDVKNIIRAFLPGSLVDMRPLRENEDLEGKELEFKVIKLDKKRNNVVLSRRSVVESENSAEREELLANLAEGQTLKGVVKNLTDYGAFIDLGGVDGLLHITDMAWKRVKHPSEVVAVGQELDVRVLKYDREKTRVSLGLKQLGEDPWVAIKSRYPEHTRLVGKVTNITDYGCFVEIEEGVEGLVHVSEMDWTNKNVHPGKVVQLEQEVEVMILDIDEERRRISLGLKQCVDNPWTTFANSYQKDDKVRGAIKSITDFGVFVGLDGGIDGLVHLSDLSWSKSGEEAVRDLRKGQEVDAIVLGIDADRERISLGIKQLTSDPFGNYISANDKNSIVTGEIKSVEEKVVVVELAPEVEATLRATEISQERVNDARDVLKVGQTIEAKIVNIDRKNKGIQLSIKAKDSHDEAMRVKQYQDDQQSQSSGATLGDLLKEQMGKEK